MSWAEWRAPPDGLRCWPRCWFCRCGCALRVCPAPCCSAVCSLKNALGRAFVNVAVSRVVVVPLTGSRQTWKLAPSRRSVVQGLCGSRSVRSSLSCRLRCSLRRCFRSASPSRQTTPCFHAASRRYSRMRCVPAVVVGSCSPLNDLVWVVRGVGHAFLHLSSYLSTYLSI